MTAKPRITATICSFLLQFVKRYYISEAARELSCPVSVTVNPAGVCSGTRWPLSGAVTSLFTSAR